MHFILINVCMREILGIESHLEHEVCELICLKCLNRWIGVFPTKTLLKNLECKCGEVGYVIKTGQTLEQTIQCVTCKHYVDNKCKLRISYNKDIWCEYYLKGENNG